MSQSPTTNAIEKGRLRPDAAGTRPLHNARTPSKSWKYVACALLVLGVAASVLGHTSSAFRKAWTDLPLRKLDDEPKPPARGQGAGNDEFEWADIKPSRKLEWHSCYDNEFDCARVDLPMDWLKPNEFQRVILAVIRLRADVEPTSPDYKGPIFFNPGGPGGSGVFAMRNRGRRIQTVAGQNHDLISFDPRGIGATLPRVDCWQGAAEKERLWGLQDIGVVDLEAGNINQGYARSAAFSEVCRESMESSQLLYHITTPYHARDMLELLALMGEAKLKYWGFSYGTVLGGYFAAMFPDKVERLVSDGNVDYLEWSRAIHINFNRDTDKVMDAFYRFCHKAGPETCDFYAPSPAAIKTRLHDLFNSLKTKPVTVHANSTSGPDMPQFVTWSSLRKWTMSVLYQPIKMFSTYARVLAALEQGDGRPYYDLVMASSATEPFCDLESLPSDHPRLEPVNNEATMAIQCSDRPEFNDTVETLEEYTRQIMELSEAAGDTQAASRLMCVGWAARAKWNFTYPESGGKTFHPILYVNNVADNITPLISARNDSARFPGSVVLTQNSYGHTTLAAPSTCTAGYIRTYFQNGTLPGEGTVCEPNYEPFDEIPSATARNEELEEHISSKEDRELAEAVLELAMSDWMS